MMNNNIATYADGENLCLVFKQDKLLCCYEFGRVIVTDVTIKQDCPGAIAPMCQGLINPVHDPITEIRLDIKSPEYRCTYGDEEKVKKEIKFLKKDSVEDLFKKINKILKHEDDEK